MVAIAPSVASYHHLLGNFYGFQQDYANAQRSIERALEIEANPDWLYTKGSAIRHQKGYDPAEVISAYQVELLFTSTYLTICWAQMPEELVS